MKFESRELRRPNAALLILFVLLPILAVATTIEPVTAVCSCPYGGTYYSSIYTRLCGLQQNVCVSFDYNCANDYTAVCGTTTTRTTPTRTVQPTSPRTCSSKCPNGGQYYESLYTSLCGLQRNICVTWDNNCANDYPACMTTTASTSTTTLTRTTLTRCTTGGAGATTSKTCSYTCPYGGQYYASILTHQSCGLQQNVCVVWDNNCADNYPAVATCG